MTNEEAIKILKSKMDGSVDTSYEWAETVRMAIKALDEPERKKGKWSFIGDNMFECTCCGTPYTTQQLNGLRNYNTDPYAPKFCPNCGADMRGEQDESKDA